MTKANARKYASILSIYKGIFHDLRQETRLLAFFLSAVVGVYLDSVAKRANSNHYAILT
jgi:hypothetical protein